MFHNSIEVFYCPSFDSRMNKKFITCHTCLAYFSVRLTLFPHLREKSILTTRLKMIADVTMDWLNTSWIIRTNRNRNRLQMKSIDSIRSHVYPEERRNYVLEKLVLNCEFDEIFLILCSTVDSRSSSVIVNWFPVNIDAFASVFKRS